MGRRQFYLVGEGIDGSFSPLIHQTIYREMGFDAQYRLFSGCTDSNGCLFLPQEFDGLNITHPYKQQILRFLRADLSDCGSVNTVVRRGLDDSRRLTDNDLARRLESSETNGLGGLSGCGGLGGSGGVSGTGDLFGYSTDGDGFVLDAIRLSLDLSDVLIVGTGGAARSICHALKEISDTHSHSSHSLNSPHSSQKSDLGAGEISALEGRKEEVKISVFSRDENRAVAFCREFGTSAFNREKKYSLVINCTPQPIAVDFFRAKEYYDLSYTRGQGLGMLIYQAILSDCLFFNREIDLKIFEKIEKCVLSAKNK